MSRNITSSVCCILLLTTLITTRIFSEDQSNIEKVTQSNTHFAIDLYQKTKTTEGNVFFSPYGISTALALTYAGARAETAKQMAVVLHLSLEDEELHSAFAEIQTRLNAIQQGEKIELHIANSLWPHKKHPFLREYVKLARTFYQAEIIPVDYERNPESAIQRINSWVERKTNNKIKDIIAGPLHPLTRLILANAIYFKGEWVSRFEKSATVEMPFYPRKNETVQVSMMQQTSDLNYGEDEILQVLEMPYTGSELSMVILLPRDIDGLHNVEEILTVDSLEKWSKNTSERPVEVYLPRFNMTFQFDLKNVLVALGMTDAFDKNKANFSGMDGYPNWSYIDFAVHKAFVDVNEEGTEAAAATVGGGCFPAGTEVLTASGPHEIEAIEAGTKVYAYDLVSGEWMLRRVLRRQSHRYDGDMITIQIGHITIKATGNHPFYVLRGDSLVSRPLPQDVPKEETRITEQGRWVEARDLKEGDVLKDKSGNGLMITSVSSRSEQTVVYNLDVDGCHNYAVHQNGILVHNKGGVEAPVMIFRADHPFLFLIRDNVTNSILFLGRVMNPLTE